MLQKNINTVDSDNWHNASILSNNGYDTMKTGIKYSSLWCNIQGISNLKKVFLKKRICAADIFRNT